MPATERMCVLLPVATGMRWAVPQNCLAELVTVPAADNRVPALVEWRGQSVPVLDLASAGAAEWRDPKSQTGLVAVFLGLRERSPDYWAVALRGEGLGVRRIDFADCVETDNGSEFALATFELDGELYGVPDLPALQAFACRTAERATA
ncbi:hypothetical protein [Haliea sp. E17]|uniref:hypothetical protein n=1 Tax=Haliea sp. E17 TaxID=3401576 RepID=UPI003AADF6FE